MDTTSRLRVLHALRLGAVLDVEGIARRAGLSVPAVAPVLESLAVEGLVAERDTPPVGWSLTPTGRAAAESAVRSEATTAVLAGIGAPYERFIGVNATFLDVCTRWQLRPGPGEEEVRNDHLDELYDRAVIDELGRLHPVAIEVSDAATQVLGRFGHYRGRFEHAWARLGRNEVDWFTKPLIDSYHTVWFELHEDLLATLGRTRASERREAVGRHASPPPSVG